MNAMRQPNEVVADFSRRTGIRDGRVDAYVQNYARYREHGIVPAVSNRQVARPQHYDIGVDLGVPGSDRSALQLFFWTSGQYYLLNEQPWVTETRTDGIESTASGERQMWHLPQGFLRDLMGLAATCMPGRTCYPWERLRQTQVVDAPSREAVTAMWRPVDPALPAHRVVEDEALEKVNEKVDDIHRGVTEMFRHGYRGYRQEPMMVMMDEPFTAEEGELVAVAEGGDDE